MNTTAGDIIIELASSLIIERDMSRDRLEDPELDRASVELPRKGNSDNESKAWPPMYRLNTGQSLHKELNKEPRKGIAWR
jgi:hypothetical protein